jgi:predicted amidohydrolase
LKKKRYKVRERVFNCTENRLCIGIANIHAIVPGIEANKEKIVEVMQVFKKKKVNMAIFPEFCLSGYFWENEKECRAYMDKAVIEKHQGWIMDTLFPMLDDDLKYIIFNNIRRGSGNHKKYLNSTYILNKTIDYMTEDYIYDKIMLPGIEGIYTRSGLDDRLVVDTKWGKFGFTTCYDFCFPQLLQEYSKIDKVDAVIQLASWRGTGRRDYPDMNVYTDTYYGDLWNILLPARCATNQIWVIACNAVGVHPISGIQFWGGSGLWAPSGIKIVQSSRLYEELLIVRNIDIKKHRYVEVADFNYFIDFSKVYRRLKGKRAFTRM